MKTNNVLFPEAKDESLWKAIREKEEFKSFRESLENAYKISCSEPFFSTSYSLYKEYRTTGKGSSNKLYFIRRLALNSSFLSYMIYREQKYLDMLQDVIMFILDEYTWACDLYECEGASIFIDLFSAETGQALSEILYILGDKLDSLVSKRIRYEVKRRIIDSFINNVYPFEDMKTNWATVCAGSVGMAFLYNAPEKFPVIKKRIEACFNNYLDGFREDGACTEGVGYWVYGFGYYIYFEELYREFTGEYLMPIKQKQRNIATFLQKAHISGKSIVSFADGSQEEFLMNGLVMRVNEIFGDDVKILPMDAYADPLVGDNCYRFAHCIRNFVWHKSEKLPKGENIKEETIFLENTEIYIKKAASYVFATKCGNNADAHNHNDVGSFLISDRKCQLLADIGKSEYTRDYFIEETRYNHLCCSSRGHSLPIIDGKEQSPGREYRGKVIKVEDNFISMDISGAYEDENLISFERSFSFEDKLIKLSDKIVEKNNTEWTDRLISLIKPTVSGNTVIIEGLTIKNSLDITPRITVEEIREHFKQELMPVYLIDYKTSERELEFDFIIE